MGEPLYASVSGGKDSCAMVGIMVEAGLGRFQCASADSWLCLPDSLPTSIAVADRFGLPLDVEEPARDPREALRAIPPSASVFEPATMEVLLRECGSGNLMVNYAYKNGYRVGFVGLRADEARGRRMSLAVHGSLYQNTVDRAWRACPLHDWSARDVFAYLVSRDIPIHPHYRRCAEAGLDPEQQRIDWLIAPMIVAQRGALQVVRRLYPALWGELLSIRPEAARYG